MTIQIQAPEGTFDTKILLKDILYLETRKLSFFGKNKYNLYVYVKKGETELYHLFVYDQLLHMQAAHTQLQTSMAVLPDDEKTVYFSAMTFA
ncbi:hypothetical protein ACSX1A_13880 [Pontibacter sp. MBLB2868]|uniref:hypothetical protein n=1 Tax=Pontibacter sp. MBLB2868 TaxID=3451555 RepID=UPI003F7543A4